MSFSLFTRGALQCLTADSFSALGLSHGFTTRLGGLSEGGLASLNLGLHRGDKPENVRGNYQILAEAFGFEAEACAGYFQAHGDDIKVIGHGDRGSLFSDCNEKYDAMVTDAVGIPLFVFSADCVPILLYEPENRVIAAVHSGWRGTALGIAGKTVSKMQALYGCEADKILAAIGPCICRSCFETDGDVPEAMYKALGPPAKSFCEKRGSKWQVDLKAINRHWLLESGLSEGNISVTGHCGACEPETFWSHRVHGGSRGSQAAFIRL